MARAKCARHRNNDVIYYCIDDVDLRVLRRTGLEPESSFTAGVCNTIVIV